MILRSLRNLALRLGPTVLAGIIAAAGLVIPGSPLRSLWTVASGYAGFYRTESGGEAFILTLAMDGGELWGTWELAGRGECGTLEGRMALDGAVELELEGNFRRTRTLQCRFLPFGWAIQATVADTRPERAARGTSLSLPGFNREGDSLIFEAERVPGFAASARLAVGSIREKARASASPSTAPQNQSVKDGDGSKDFSVGGVDLAGAAARAYALAVRRGLGLREYAQMRMEELRKGRAFAAAFRERTAVFVPAHGLFSTVTIRESGRNTNMTTTAKHRLFALLPFDLSSSSGESRPAVLPAQLHPGEELYVETVFPPESLPVLEGLLTDLAKRSAGLAAERKLSEAGFFVDSIPPTGELFVCEGGLGFAYDRYRIAPQTAGVFRFVLPWKAIQALLRPGLQDSI